MNDLFKKFDKKLKALLGEEYDNAKQWYNHSAGNDKDEALIQNNVLKFCVCGDPMSNLIYVRDGLTCIHRCAEGGFENNDKIQKEYFKSVEEKNFFYYWADMMHFSTHGTSVNGSWTEYDCGLLEILNYIIKK